MDVNAANFSDTAGHWAKADIDKAFSLGFVKGKSEYTFDPNTNVTRAEYIAMLNRAFPGALTEHRPGQHLLDVTVSDWFYGDVTRAMRSGLVSNPNGEVFAPNEAITREECAMILIRYMEACGFVSADDATFDFQDSDMIIERRAVATLASNYIITGYLDGTFRPNACITRAENAVIVNRAYATLYAPKPTMDDYYEKLDGSTVTLPLSRAIMCGQLGVAPAIAGAIISHNQTDAATKKVIDGTKELALVTYPSDENLANARNQGIKLAIIPIVNDAFVFMVNEANPVSDLTIQQIKDIYSGRITNWSELGGEDMPIIPLQRNAESGSQSGMLSFMGDTGIMVPYMDAQVVKEMGMLIELVNEEPGAIGYSYYYYASNMYLSHAKLLCINGYPPTNANITSGIYPIVTQYYAVFRNSAPEGGFARTVTEYILSMKGQEIVEREGYVKIALSQRVALPAPDGDVTMRPTNEKRFLVDDMFNKLRVFRSVRGLIMKIAENDYSRFSSVPVNVVDSEDAVATVAAIIDGEIDLALCFYPSKDALDYVGKQDVELEIIPIIKDRLAFITGVDNPLSSLTIRQLGDAFTKKVTNWSALGGENKDILVYGANTSEHDVVGDVTRQLFESLGISEIYAEGTIMFMQHRWFMPYTYPLRANELDYALFTQLDLQSDT
ncbi:MAG: substrate-binding domain-containing protein, partial [Oscillospiraceae bacterium]|nr:substrate-binding domain-containing protein [Oscillospiraceae bacterium]